MAPVPVEATPPPGRLGLALRSLAPILAYYLADWAWGLRPAIVASALWSMGEVALHLVQRQPLDSLFKFTAATTLLFGGVDLLCTQPWLFSYEPVVTNVVTAGFLALLARGSLAPVLESIYQARPDLRGDPGVVVRIRLAVWVLVAFTAAKVPLFLWMAASLPVERAMTLRTVVGAGSLAVVFLVIRFATEPLVRLGRRWGWVSAEEAD